MACLDLFWSVSVRGHCVPALSLQLLTGSSWFLTYAACIMHQATQSHTGCASQRTQRAPVPNKDGLSAGDVCPGTRCHRFPAPIPAALHSAWHAFISPNAAAAHKELFICLLTPVRKLLTNILGKSLRLWGSHMCEPVAGAHAVPSPFVRVLYRGIKMSSVRCALRRMRFASLMSL